MFNLNPIKNVFPPPFTISLQSLAYITFLRYIFGQTIKPVFLFAAASDQIF